MSGGHFWNMTNIVRWYIHATAFFPNIPIHRRVIYDRRLWLVFKFMCQVCHEFKQSYSFLVTRPLWKHDQLSKVIYTCNRFCPCVLSVLYVLQMIIHCWAGNISCGSLSTNVLKAKPLTYELDFSYIIMEYMTCFPNNLALLYLKTHSVIGKTSWSKKS